MSVNYFSYCNLRPLKGTSFWMTFIHHCVGYLTDANKDWCDPGMLHLGHLNCISVTMALSCQSFAMPHSSPKQILLPLDAIWPVEMEINSVSGQVLICGKILMLFGIMPESKLAGLCHTLIVLCILWATGQRMVTVQCWLNSFRYLSAVNSMLSLFLLFVCWLVFNYLFVILR